MAKNQVIDEPTPAPAASEAVYDFTYGMPDVKLHPKEFSVWSALSRQHRLAEPERRDEYPHPDGKTFTVAELKARGIDPDNLPLLKPTCCGK